MPWSLELLEFDAMKALVRRGVHSPQGRELLEAISPCMDREALNAAHADAQEALHYLRDGDETISFTGIPEIAAPLAKVRVEGATLDPLELLTLASFLSRSQDIRAALRQPAPRYPRLAAHAAGIADFTAALRELEGKILPDGTLDDHASPELARLRKEKQRQQKAIEEALLRFLRAHREDNVLQEEFVTLRNERFVVPLVASQRGKVAGVVHGSSASGQSVFVEPLETIELNNALVRLHDDELREVHRILRALSARLRQEHDAMRAAAVCLGGLDLIFGKAAFARDFAASIPRFGPRLDLRGLRHPLLVDVLRKQRKSVVPLSVTLQEGARMLLISGPNTGGKTVAMKSIGLAALMAQSGLPVLAEDAELPLFEQVLADIGDNQSISESLSSFSSHVVRIREIHETVTPDSLVILDELGRATDPDEGGALATVILNDLRAIGACCCASTHLAAVKVWGANTPGVINASMGFNDETLEPTYVLRTGAPGKSAGLDIAARLGIPPRVIAEARGRLTTAGRDIARFINELHQKIEAVEQSERELLTERARLKQREEQLERDTAAKQASSRREMEQRFAAAVAEFEQRTKAVIEEIEQKQSAEKARLRAARVKREFAGQVESIAAPVADGGSPAARALELAEGVRVRLKGIREIARVRRILEHGIIEVEAGFLKLQVPREDVTEVLPDAPDAGGSRLPKNVRFEPAGPSWLLSQREIHVIGKRAEEAITEVDQFLDKAALASVERVRIVHGHGMGILKRAVQDLLRVHPHVAKYYPATPAEGGTGATIAELKA
jgi:DNA mismatch repair protein MutS2